MQYDNVSEEVGISTRLQWIPKAGQEGFIVLNYNLEDKDNTSHLAAAGISVKFRYAFRF